MTPEMVWASALDELQLEMAKATFDAWVKPTVLLSVNVSWRIGTPSKYSLEWLDTRLSSTVKRILSGLVGQPVDLEFVIIKENRP